MMILNTGSRTDIPGFFADWFYRRVREGYVLVRNPYYPQQILRYRISPEVVDCIVFCTKNPAPMLNRLSELDAYRQFWFTTITPYGKDIEPFVPDKEQVCDDLRRISEQVGIGAVGWRYDPIFLLDDYDIAFHVKAFENMAKRLEGSVDQVTISFIDLYEKTRRNFPRVKEVSRQDQILLAKEFVAIGKAYGMQIRSCHEGDFLAEYGVEVSGCMNQQVIERAIGGSIRVPKKPTARQGCNCLLGSDIGAYHSCGHGCLYCYANYDRKTVEQNRAQHDPLSPLLIGHTGEGDVIKDARQESWYEGQLSLDMLLQSK
jgi:hypothetical protein